MLTSWSKNEQHNNPVTETTFQELQHTLVYCLNPVWISEGATTYENKIQWATYNQILHW